MNSRSKAWIVSMSSMLAVTGIANVAISQDLILDRDTPPLNPLSALDPLSFEAFVQRPLFSPSRRPPADPLVESASLETTTESLDVRLLGIVVTPEGSVARIAEAGQSKTRSLRRGDVYRDWQVLSVDQSTLKLGKDGETHLFSVFAKPGSDADVSIAAKTRIENSIDKNIVDTSAKTRLGQADQTSVASSQQTKNQDLIDFFGPTGQPAE